MARYIRQPVFNMPNTGQQNISHLTEFFSEANPANLQAAVNSFLDGLTLIPDTPQIFAIYYQVDGGVWTAMVHYVLVS